MKKNWVLGVWKMFPMAISGLLGKKETSGLLRADVLSRFRAELFRNFV